MWDIYTKEMVADNANGIRERERVLVIGLSPTQKHCTLETHYTQTHTTQKTHTTQ